jgi:hypothetical protein
MMTRRQQPLAMLGPPHAGGIVLGIDVEHADPGRLAASDADEFTRVPTPQILEPMRIEHRILEAVRAGGPLIRAPGTGSRRSPCPRACGQRRSNPTE